MRKTLLGWRKFLQYTRAEQVLLVQAALLLAAVRLGLYVLAFHSLRRLVQWAARPTLGRHRPQSVSASQIVWAVVVASNYVPHTGTCLPRALAGQVLLGRYGFPARLHIGIARAENGLVEGHAWVERDGNVVLGGIDTDIERYIRIAGLEGNI